MCMDDLIKKAEDFLDSSTREEQVELLKSAHILDDNGFLSSDFYPEDTVKENKDKGISFI